MIFLAAKRRKRRTGAGFKDGKLIDLLNFRWLWWLVDWGG